MNRFRAILLLVLVFSLASYPVRARGESMTVQKGGRVSFDYTLTVNGEVVDSSEGRGPLQYIHGEGQIIPGLARQLKGMRVGQAKKVEVFPEEGYGQVDPDAFQEMPLSTLPANMKPKVGMTLHLRDSAGKAIPARISELKENSIILDLNHPLAGKTLIFEVKIVFIK